MRILMSMFGWKDSGGGTIFPRQLALELQARGHQVMVIYAGVPRFADAPAYAIHAHEEAGVQLIGIHNRPAVFLDDLAPGREIHDPEIVKIFQHYFLQFQPDLVHYHNFLGLSLGIAEVAHAAGIPSFYTPYNFWLLCPTLYLNLPNLALCQGVNASGSNCLNCTQSTLPGHDYVHRRDQLRENYQRMIGPCLATSDSVRELMLANGYPDERIEIVKLGNDRAQKIWLDVGQRREPGVSTPLRIGFMGALLAIKGVHTLVAAAQLLKGAFRISLHGEGPADYIQQLRALDTKGIIEFAGRFPDAGQGELLSQLHLGVVSSICYDHSPLVIGEFQAARVPVVGARIGGIPDYIQPGTGALYEAGNVQALAAALQALIDDPSPILAWQAAMRPPLAFASYVNTLESKYVQTLEQGRSERLSRAIERFLSQRKPAQIFYHARHLFPLPAAQTPYALDIQSPDQLQSLPAEILAGATWLSLGDSALLQAPEITASPIPKLELAPWSGPKPATEAELPTDKSIRVLLPLRADDTGWQAPLRAWLEAFGAQDDVCLILLPWLSDAEACQEKVLSFIEAIGQAESAAEMILLDQAGEDLSALVPDFALTLLTPTLSAHAPSLWAACNGQALLLAGHPRPEILAPMAAPAALAPWLAQLTDYRLLAPQAEALQALFAANRQKLHDRLLAHEAGG